MIVLAATTDSADEKLLPVVPSDAEVTQRHSGSTSDVQRSRNYLTRAISSFVASCLLWLWR